MSKFMVYGCTGFTGRLISKLAVQRGLKERIVLAGRTESSVLNVAEQLGVPRDQCRSFCLDNPRVVSEKLADVRAVLNCAGPFEETAHLFTAGCLETGVHYLDITGEIDVFEACAKLDNEAKAKGIKIIPGVGMDVVPTDCLARALKKRLPDGTNLELVLETFGMRASRGTTKTVLLALQRGEGSKARHNGRIVNAEPASKTFRIPTTGDIPAHDLFSASVTWGDVSTSYYSTEGTPNIKVFFPSSRLQMFALAYILPLLFRIPIFSTLLLKTILYFATGPSEQHMQDAKAVVYGEMRNDKGEGVSGSVLLPEGYRFTADSALRATLHVLEQSEKEEKEEQGRKGGFFTPSLAFGEEFVLECEGTMMGEFHTL